MPLVFAGITPHSPLLLPSIGKEHCHRAEKTTTAIAQLKEELYASHPDMLIVLSPHEGLYERSFVAYADEKITADLSDLGDMVTTQTWPGAMAFASQLSHRATHHHGFDVRLVSHRTLGHGTSVPLLLMADILPDISILPLGFNSQNTSEHLRFGELLKDMIADSNKRIAVLVSGDLSHRHSNNSPAGKHDAAETFDSTIMSLIENRNTTGIVSLDEQVVTDAHQCIHRSLAILFGIIKNTPYTAKTLSYEHPFGIGYMVSHIDLPV